MNSTFRDSSVAGDSVQPQYPSGALRSARESLPSVDSAVDSWGEIGEVNGAAPEIMRLWETTSVDSGQLDLLMPPYSRQVYLKEILQNKIKQIVENYL